jgi:type IV pilus assembly protein PilE
MQKSDLGCITQKSSSMKRCPGFTLIELMITVAVVAILATVAVPSYTQYVVRANRSAMQRFMLDVANREEQFMLDARQYRPAIKNKDDDTDTFPAQLNMSVPSDVSNYYNMQVTLVAGPPPGYTITATPIAGTMQAGDGILTLNNTGVKTPPVKW